MSRYNNVITFLEVAEDYNLDKIVELFLDEDQPTEDLAEDLGFVLVSMWAMVTVDKREAFRDRLTDEIVNLEIREMFEDGLD